MREQARVIEIEEPAVDRFVRQAEVGRPVIVTRDARPVAVVITIEAFEALTEERELLRRLALGELESAGGAGEDLEMVLEDCRLLLEEN